MCILGGVITGIWYSRRREEPCGRNLACSSTLNSLRLRLLLFVFFLFLSVHLSFALSEHAQTRQWALWNSPLLLTTLIHRFTLLSSPLSIFLYYCISIKHDVEVTDGWNCKQCVRKCLKTWYIVYYISQYWLAVKVKGNMVKETWYLSDSNHLNHMLSSVSNV